MINWLYVILLTLLPGIELRGSIPLGILLGMDPAMIFLVTVIINILLIPFAFIFLDLFWNFLSKFKFFTNFVQKKRKMKATSFTALALFVAIPLPGSGAYTGALIAKIFNLNKKMSFVAIAFGVAVAGLIVSLMTLGSLEILRLIF